MRDARILAVAIPLVLALGCGSGVKTKGENDGSTDPDTTDLADGTDGTVACTEDSDCDDGDDCNGAETCEAGECVDGTPLDDGDPCEVDGAEGECTEGVCVPLTCGDGALDAGEECDDGNDVADDGCEATCRFSCHEAAECDDDNVCTDDSCGEGGTGRICIHEDNTDPCDDGDECTDPDTCSDGECQPGPGVCGCTEDDDCIPYEDDDLCNGTLVCGEDGNCEVDPATIVECPSSDTVCLTYTCDPSTGDCDAGHASAGTACEDDSDACTDDECDGSGACAHAATDCDDSNPCTTDSCDTTTGCAHAPISGCCMIDTDCDDTDLCTTDTCETDHTCTHAARDCYDTDLCTTDSCDPTSGCVHASIDCSDSNDCTTDHCYPDAGCVYGFVTGPCDDGDPCTGPDTCNTTGTCIPGPDLPVWYEDSDGDGFGDPTSTTCASTMPSGYADNDDDCCDSEPDVFPGQTSYFCPSFTCVGTTTTSWDYNCGGADVQRWTGHGYCYHDWTGACRLVEGWNGYSTPACGVTADFVSGCTTTTCSEVVTRQCQECR